MYAMNKHTHTEMSSTTIMLQVLCTYVDEINKLNIMFVYCINALHFLNIEEASKALRSLEEVNYMQYILLIINWVISLNTFCICVYIHQNDSQRLHQFEK